MLVSSTILDSTGPGLGQSSESPTENVQDKSSCRIQDCGAHQHSRPTRTSSASNSTSCGLDLVLKFTCSASILRGVCPTTPDLQSVNEKVRDLRLRELFRAWRDPVQHGGGPGVPRDC